MKFVHQKNVFLVYPKMNELLIEMKDKYTPIYTFIKGILRKVNLHYFLKYLF